MFLAYFQDNNQNIITDKLQPIDFTRKREKDPTGKGKTQPKNRQPLELVDRSIKPTPMHKLLGLILDQELRSKHYASHGMAKGTDWILHLQRLAKPTQGLSYHYTCQLYLSVALPKMTYAADIWFTPIHHSNNSSCHLSMMAFGSVGFANKLVKVQRIVALHIAGALCSTTTDLLDTHVNLVPIRLTLDQQLFNSTL